AKTLEVRESLSAVVGSPAPLSIDGPQRYVRKDDDRSAARQPFDVLLQPFQLVLAQLTEAIAAKPGAIVLLKIQDINHADKFHANIIEPLPAAALRATTKSFEVDLPIVSEHIMLAWDIVNLRRSRAFENLRSRVELFRL